MEEIRGAAEKSETLTWRFGFNPYRRFLRVIRSPRITMLRFRPVLALPSSKAFLFPQYTPRKNLRSNLRFYTFRVRTRSWRKDKNIDRRPEEFFFNSDRYAFRNSTCRAIAKLRAENFRFFIVIIIIHNLIGERYDKREFEFSFISINSYKWSIILLLSNIYSH